MEKLKPCPFCGSNAVEILPYEDVLYYAECRRCFTTSAVKRTREQAIALWNMRTEVADLDIPVYNKETQIKNCTVQILENTTTGQTSIGWWKNE